MKQDYTLCVIGLGYVGLPLAVEFSKSRDVIGFDINQDRIEELSRCYDRTMELDSETILNATNLAFTSNLSDLKKANVYIVTVPTPIDSHNEPDLSPLVNACRDIGKFLKEGDVVIFESTVYPGATEEVCVPNLEETSGLIFNQNFYCGYSPERINPGDKINNIRTIKKVTSGSTHEIAIFIDSLYAEIIDAGTYLAPSIKIAEAAKVIENTQRDINIALMNELSLIFNKLGIETEEVLKAAETKWNFLSFRPGLVGGHCIGVDPYYLTYKANELGYYPEMILSGRRINNFMSSHIANEVAKLMLNKRINIIDSNILIMGFTFKENCPDIRNTKVENLVKELSSLNAKVEIFDPIADKSEIQNLPEINFISEIKKNHYDGVIFAVAHDEFKVISPEEINSYTKENSIIFDVKDIFPNLKVDGRL